MNTILDVLLLRRPKIDYVSPPICEIIFSSTAHPVIVLDPFHRRHGPTGLRTSGVGNFFLTWERSPGDLCYSVYKATTSDPFGPYELVSECNEDNFIDLSSTPPFGPGCYRVSVITVDGESELSDPICSVGSNNPPPNIITDDATNIFTTMATINGRADPFTVAGFQWGLTIAYGTTTTLHNVGPGSGLIAFSEPLVGLSGGTTYHFRAIAQDLIAVGADKTFTTLTPPPGPNIDIVALNPTDDLSEDGVVSGVFH